MSRTPIHPGEILRDELKEISITANTALQRGKWSGTTPNFWLNLQKCYELRRAAKQIGDEIDAIPTRPKEPA